MQNEPYDLLIFDWDGTLSDSAMHIVDCMQRAARALGLAECSAANIRNMIGLGLQEVIQRLYPGITSGQQRELIQEYREEYLLRNWRVTPLFAGARQTLEQLRDAGYHLAIATGKSRRGLECELVEHDLQDLFVLSRCADETLSKPNPLMLQEILTDYNASADCALMIGDTEYDLQMAANIGMAALAVSYGAHDRERLLALQPIACLDAITELPAYLNDLKHCP